MPPISPQSVEDEVDVIIVVVVESVVKEPLIGEPVVKKLVVAVYLNGEVEGMLGHVIENVAVVATIKEVMVLGEVEVEDVPIMVETMVTVMTTVVILVVMVSVVVMAPVVPVLMLTLMILILEEVIIFAFGHMVRNTSLPSLLHPPLCVAWSKPGAVAQVNIHMSVGVDGLAVVAKVCAAPDTMYQVTATVSLNGKATGRARRPDLPLPQLSKLFVGLRFRLLLLLCCSSGARTTFLVPGTMCPAFADDAGHLSAMVADNLGVSATFDTREPLRD